MCKHKTISLQSNTNYTAAVTGPNMEMLKLLYRRAVLSAAFTGKILLDLHNAAFLCNVIDHVC